MNTNTIRQPVVTPEESQNAIDVQLYTIEEQTHVIDQNHIISDSAITTTSDSTFFETKKASSDYRLPLEPPTPNEEFIQNIDEFQNTQITKTHIETEASPIETITPLQNKDQQNAIEESVNEPTTHLQNQAPFAQGQSKEPIFKKSTGIAKKSPKALVCPFPRYPRIALRKALEGLVKLEVTLHPDGTPNHVRVKVSSGYSFFDREASETVKSEWQFEQTAHSAKSFEVAIHFKLEN